MQIPLRGEVWLIDFGMAGKTRPALVPHMTRLRGSPFEIATRVRFLKPGAFLVQGVTTFPTVKGLHQLGTLPPEAFDKVLGGLLRWLGHFPE